MNEKSNDNAREEKPSKIDEKQQQETAKILASRDSDTPRLQRASSKPPSTDERWNCLCSPTTHAGSFRCRFHRSSGMIRGGSTGSRLSELATTSRPISDLV
ncbi:hypothetical protein DKX38_017566 [Salix brachista]|uniref:Uncharacterized protein n=1 Tax=Salix brachista TaxID=2182728 RepID=A0A5N5KVL2_9ROSI|nr:hypothetical protein DKX38_017566 [Salix brachista]